MATVALPSPPPEAGYWPIFRGVFWGYAAGCVVLLLVGVLVPFVGIPATGSTMYVWGLHTWPAALASIAAAALASLPAAWFVDYAVQVRTGRAVGLLKTWLCVSAVGVPVWMAKSGILSVFLTAFALWLAIDVAPILTRVRATRVATTLSVIAFVGVFAYAWVHPYASPSSSTGEGERVEVDLEAHTPLGVHITEATLARATTHGLRAYEVTVRHDVARVEVTSVGPCPQDGGRSIHVRAIDLTLATPLGTTHQRVATDVREQVITCRPPRR